MTERVVLEFPDPLPGESDAAYLARVLASRPFSFGDVPSFGMLPATPCNEPKPGTTSGSWWRVTDFRVQSSHCNFNELRLTVGGVVQSVVSSDAFGLTTGAAGDLHDGNYGGSTVQWGGGSSFDGHNVQQGVHAIFQLSADVAVDGVAYSWSGSSSLAPLGLLVQCYSGGAWVTVGWASMSASAPSSTRVDVPLTPVT